MEIPPFIKTLRKIRKEKLKNGTLMTFDDYRAKVTELVPPYSDNIDRIIIYHFLSNTKLKKVKDTIIPYNGVVATGQKLVEGEDKAINLLYTFEDLPSETQELLLAYVGYLSDA